MQLQFHPDALAEFAASVARYEQQQAGLGARFLASVQVAILGILDEPLVLDPDETATS